jgi:hypothetical protein
MRYSQKVNTFPIATDDPFNYRSYATCASVNDGNYVSIVSVDDAPGTLIARFTEYDKNGVEQFTTEIRSVTKYAHLVPLDIIKYSNTDYIICGYIMESNNVNDIRPWIAYVNASGVLGTSRYFNDTGIFARVEKLPDGKLVCCGFRGNGTTFSMNFRNANLKVITSSLVQQNSFSIGNGAAGISLNIMHDLEVLNLDSLIITGTVNEICSGGVQSRTFLMCVNPFTGVVHWQNNSVTGNYMSPKILCDSLYVYQLVNASNPNEPLIMQYDKYNGNLILSKAINISNFYDCTNKLINSDSVLFQSLLKRKNGNLLFTGKVISYLGEMPFDLEINPTNFSVVYSNAYITRFKSTNIDFYSYSAYSTNNCSSVNSVFLPLGSTSFSTIFDDDIVSTTTFCTFVDNPNNNPPIVYKYFTWTFNNNYSSVAGIKSLSSSLNNFSNISSSQLQVISSSFYQWNDFYPISSIINLTQLPCNDTVYPCVCN